VLRSQSRKPQHFAGARAEIFRPAPAPSSKNNIKFTKTINFSEKKLYVKFKKYLCILLLKGPFSKQYFLSTNFEFFRKYTVKMVGA
jgi:hypothetical protein